MFYILIQLLMIPIFCGVYVLAKNKIRSFRGLQPVTISQEIHMVLLIAYCLLFMLSGGFLELNTNGSVQSWLNHLDKSEWFPVQVIKNALGLIRFHQYIDPDFTSEDAFWMLRGQLEFLKDLGRVFLAYMPIALGIVILHKKFLSGLGIAVVLESLLYFQMGGSFMGMSIVFSVLSFSMMFLVNRVILNFTGSSETDPVKSLKTGVLVISMLLMCLFLVGHIHVHTNALYTLPPTDTKHATTELLLSDQGLVLKKPEIAAYDGFVRIDGYLEDRVPFELPYEVARKEYLVQYKCGDLELGTIETRGMNDTHFSLSLHVYDPRDPQEPCDSEVKLVLYPLEVKGISQILYKIEDPKLLDQLEVIDENWTEIVPYPIYEMTYRVPKFKGYTSTWHQFQRLNLKPGILKNGQNLVYPSYRREIEAIDEGATTKITIRYAYYGVDFKEIEASVFTVEGVDLLKELGEVGSEPALTIEDESYFD